MITASGDSYVPFPPKNFSASHLGGKLAGTKPAEGLASEGEEGGYPCVFTGYTDTADGAVGCGGEGSVDRRRDRADPDGPGRRGPGGGWDSYEEGMDRLRDRDRGRFEHRIDRQGEFTERLDDRLDRIYLRLARLEERAQRLLEDRGRP
jgi:hypothetical protein